MDFLERTDCPFCSSSLVEKTEKSFHRNKHANVKWCKSSIYKCKECFGMFANRVPTKEGFISSYSSYAEQNYGLKRFVKAFPKKKNFDKNERVLEVGGGNKGISEICKFYKSVEINSAGHYKMTFDDLSDDDFAKLEKESFQSIVTCDCIEHVLFPRSFFRNAHRILKKGDKMYMHFGEIHSKGKIDNLKEIQFLHINIPTHLSVVEMSKKYFEIEVGSPHSNPGYVFVRK